MRRGCLGCEGRPPEGVRPPEPEPEPVSSSHLPTHHLALAARHAIAPRAQLPPLLASLGIATLAAGALGTCMGIIATFKAIQHVPVAEQGTIAMLGISESLTNLVLALIVCTLLPLLGGIGSWRARSQAAEA